MDGSIIGGTFLRDKRVLSSAIDTANGWYIIFDGALFFSLGTSGVLT